MGEFGEAVEELRAGCETLCDMLRELTRIHVEIDAPERRVGAQEPDWILRMRKLCLHAMAMCHWEVDVDTMHVMATELRAAYVQMDAVWKCVPDEFRLEEVDGSSWANKARVELATYDHPTPLSLTSPLAEGGFGDGDDPRGYLRLVAWLNHLALGYGLALAHLARVLGTEGDIDSRIAGVAAATAHALAQVADVAARLSGDEA